MDTNARPEREPGWERMAVLGRADRLDAVGVTGDIAMALARRFSAALAWWVAELRALVPPSWRERLLPRPVSCLAEITGSAVELSRVSGVETALLCPVPFEDGKPRWPEDLGSDTASFLNAQGIGAGNIILRLPHGTVLRRRMSLPATPARYLRRVIAHELVFQTPFTPDQIYFDYRVLTPHRPDGGMSVEIALARQEDVAQAMEIVHGLGLAPSQILHGPPGNREAQFDLLRDPRLPRKIHWPPIVVAGLSALALVLLAGVVLAQDGRAVETQRLVTAKLAALQGQAQEAESLRQKIAVVTDRMSFLPRERQVDRPDRVLEELARVLPDDAWVNHFDDDGKTVQISGYSKTANRLIVLLDGSALFDNARFTAPTMASDVAGSEQFEISLQVTGSGGGANGGP